MAFVAHVLHSLVSAEGNAVMGMGKGGNCRVRNESILEKATGYANEWLAGAGWSDETCLGVETVDMIWTGAS